MPANQKNERRRGMNNIGDFIQKIIDEARLASKSVFEEHVYKDEPIITTASRLENKTPEKYAEMKKLASGQYGYLSFSRTFLMQARFMSDFEDDYDKKAPFTCYYPTFRTMNDAQLRTYFTWRTQLRGGNVYEVSTSYAFIYIYELLALVGANGAADAFCKLCSFGDVYGAIDPVIGAYLEKWKNDFIVYYGLDRELLGTSPDAVFSDAVKTLEDAPDDDEKLFSAIALLSSYGIERSKLYKKHPEKTKKVICRVWRDFSEYSAKKNSRSAAERFFGVAAWSRYEMFNGAVFCDTEKAVDREYEVCESYKYKRERGSWYKYAYPAPDKKNSKLGGMIKFADSLIRVSLGEAPLKAEGTKILTEITGGALLKVNEEERLEEKRNIRIDFTALDDIRSASVRTRESLLTDEERDPEPTAGNECYSACEKDTACQKETPPESKDADESAAQEKPEPYGLSDAERDIIKAILLGENADKAARKHGLILSVAVEEINEKLYDAICDNAIYFEGDDPHAEEYYIDFLKEIPET